MVLRILLWVLLPLVVLAQTTPKFRFMTYVGDGGDNERVIDTGMDQQITAVFVTVPLDGFNDEHPGFVYFRTRSCDNFVGTRNGCDADSICFFGTQSGAVTVTPKGIKRFDNRDTVIVGKHLNRSDTTYYMWIISDPDTQATIEGIWVGDGTDPRTINTGAPDSIRGLLAWPERNDAAQSHPALWVRGGSAFQYWGERGAGSDIDNVTAFSFDVRDAFLANMNEPSKWYAYFGVMKNSRYTETFSYTGNSSPTSGDTLLYAIDNFRSFLAIGTCFKSASSTVGSLGSVFASPAGNADTTWNVASTSGANVATGAGAAGATMIKNIVDTLIIRNNSTLDVNGENVRIFCLGDTVAFFTPAGGGTTTTNRQPCEGNAEISQPGNVEINDRYIE